jgi:hypothetical protein
MIDRSKKANSGLFDLTETLVIDPDSFCTKKGSTLHSPIWSLWITVITQPFFSKLWATCLTRLASAAPDLEW